MPTTALSGKNGSVLLDSTQYEVTQWSANLEDELLDGTSFESSGYKEQVVGLRSGTGSLTMVGSIMPNTASSTAAIILQASQTAGDLKLTGSVHLQTRTASVPVDGRVEYTADFTFTGTITETTV